MANFLLFLSGNNSQAWLYAWLAIGVIALVVELITIGLTSIWIVGGALAAILINALHGPVWLQIVVFFIVTFVLLYFTRPWAVKYLNRHRSATNADSAIGHQVRIIERVDNVNETGRAIYNGMEWTARAASSDEIFEINELAEVVEISGVKLMVKKIKSDEIS
ncbi:MAG: NfeD family protein [Lachnospiraceae bacterium]|nr:NfeD family protein [Lachnospiraceae bacterium]